MLGFGQGFGPQGWGRPGGRGKSSYYGSPQAIQQRITHKKKKIDKLNRDIQRLEHDLRRASPPKPPAPARPAPPKPPVPAGPKPGPRLTEAQKDARYLARYKDIAKAVKLGRFKTGRAHWKKHGKKEGRVFDGLQRPGFLAGFGGWWNK